MTPDRQDTMAPFPRRSEIYQWISLTKRLMRQDATGRMSWRNVDCSLAACGWDFGLIHMSIDLASPQARLFF